MTVCKEERYIIISLPSLRRTWFRTGNVVGKKGKAIPVQAWTVLRGSRTMRLPDIRTIGTRKCQSHTPAAFNPLPPSPRKYSWYSFLLEAESTLGPHCGRKDYANEIFQ